MNKTPEEVNQCSEFVGESWYIGKTVNFLRENVPIFPCAAVPLLSYTEGAGARARTTREIPADSKVRAGRRLVLVADGLLHHHADRHHDDRLRLLLPPDLRPAQAE